MRDIWQELIDEERITGLRELIENRRNEGFEKHGESVHGEGPKDYKDAAVKKLLDALVYSRANEENLAVEAMIRAAIGGLVEVDLFDFS